MTRDAADQVRGRCEDVGLRKAVRAQRFGDSRSRVACALGGGSLVEEEERPASGQRFAHARELFGCRSSPKDIDVDREPAAVADRSMRCIDPDSRRSQMIEAATPGPPPISNTRSDPMMSRVSTAQRIRSGIVPLTGLAPTFHLRLAV
jgi:hypothetical protein